MRCYGVALHHKADIASALKTRIFVGTYDIKLTASAGHWQINELKFNVKFIDGNTELEKSQ